MNEDKETYYLLCDKIIEKGTQIHKRHGYYYHVNVFDGYSLCMDSWNKAIEVRKDNKYLKSIGIDFGGFRCDIVDTRFWLGHACLFTPYKENSK